MQNFLSKLPFGKKRSLESYNNFGYVFLLPFFLAFLVFQLYPILYTVFLSFTDLHGFETTSNMVGFKNYLSIFNNDMFRKSVSNTFILWVINFIPQIGLALLLSAWFTNVKLRLRGTGFFKIIFYLPNIITAASVAVLFYALFSYPLGPMNLLLQNAHIVSKPIAFLRSEWGTRAIVSFIQFWMWYGQTTIVLVAGIMSIDESLFEAAIVDGANDNQVFRLITLPLLKPMMPLMQFIGNFGYGAVCLVGAILAIDGKIEFGVIVAFMIYIRLFTQPLTQIAQAVTSMQSAGAASERIFTFLAEPELEDETGKATTLVNPKGAVEFKNVHFGYNADRVIINDFSAKAEPGQKIAIVGPTGAGKSTMVNLLMRFYDIDSGQIIIDGTPIKEVTREAVHDQFSMVLQDTWLFEGTVKENLIYNQCDITDEQVVAAAKAVGVDHFINTLPNGYDSVLKDADELSVGERQLLTIARALLKNAPMLILDEATSSVDTRTEELIQKAMDKLMEGRTSFVIAHRLSTIKNADLILVMKDGDIIESGNHEALLAQGGFYADLYNSQFESVA